MTANPVAIAVFLILFVLVSCLGFVATKWRKADLHSVHEWGLGGRSFGTLITWFLLGGDLYTAYTFIAVPAAMFATGAAGFFAVPYTILIYPILFLCFPRLWAVAHARGYVTAADYVQGRFGSKTLALAIAVTGIAAIIPYVALQLVGMQVVFAGLGIPSTFAGIPNLPVIIAFGVLAAYTYSSGLRGTALTAVVKDLLIYITVLSAIIVIPAALGGYGKVFASIDPKQLLLAHGSDTSLGGTFSYASLAFGSALALFLYPHSLTGILSSSSSMAIRRNAILLPAYSLALALLALLGYMAVAAGIKAMPEYAAGFKAFGNNFAIPALILHMFPAWFVGLAFAAIAIGALVPASIMAIASGNLFTRNIYKAFIAPGCSERQEGRAAKLASLSVKIGALLFVLFFPTSAAIQLQLLGGVWICQTLPAVLLSLYTRWFHPIGLVAGWIAGIVSGSVMAWQLSLKSSVYPLHLGSLTIPCYAAVLALLLNIVVAVVVSLAMNAAAPDRADETVPADYRA
ncbi:MAG: sodium:solute symporter [Alphaproteobacteria bacterium]|nr:sodium:solute symporter [Alphaproteobacteria bacterium]